MTTTQPFPRRDRRPLYQQVSDAIRTEVLEGRLVPDQRLPSEPELALQYAVSRATIREALRALEQEGVVQSRRGYGTFIADPGRRLHLGIGSLYSVSDAIRRQGRMPGSREVHTRTVAATRQQREQLRLPEGARVISLERTRLADGEPVVYSVDVIAEEQVHGLNWREPLTSGSLFDLLLRVGVRLSHTTTSFTATCADATVAARLDLALGEAVLRLDELVYDEADRPIIISRDYYRTDQIEVQLARRRQS